MIDYEVIPHVGIGPVRLGMSRDDVRRAMPGPCHPFLEVPDASQETDAFHENRFQVFYSGTAPVAEYIELSRHSGFRTLYRGVDVFATPADVVVSHVARDAAFDPDDWELGYSYIFPTLDLSLWQPAWMPMEGKPANKTPRSHRPEAGIDLLVRDFTPRSDTVPG